MKKIITAVLTLALLTALTGAAAGEAGTASDPLVTKNYVDTGFTRSVLEKGQELIESSLGGLDAAIDIAGQGGETYTFTSGRECFVSTSADAAVSLARGGSFVLISGGAAVTVSSGEVIDVSAGEVVASGSALRPFVRYFCSENTHALFTLSSNAAFILDGPYSAGTGIVRQYVWYEDVQGTEWFAGVARYSFETHLFHDWDAPRFRAGDTATRAEMIYALWVSAGSPETDFVSPFVDLAEPWYVPAVNWAYEHGITNGSGAADLFDPTGSLSRQQIATMFYRWSAERGMDVSARADLTAFPDSASIDEWAVEGAAWASAAGLIYGYEDSTFRPRSDISRAEVVTILQRYEPLVQSRLPSDAPGAVG